MNGHGGSRAGSGASQRGVSQAKRLIVKAIERGLEVAGRERGLVGTPEDVVIEAAGQIAADMIRSQRGDELLKLYALTAPAREGDKPDSAESSLERALARMPGMIDSAALEGPQTSLDGLESGQTPATARVSAGRPSDQRSDDQENTPQNAPRDPVTLDERGCLLPDGPKLFFGGQPPLFSGGLVGGSRSPYGQRSASTAPPYPLDATLTPTDQVRTGKFENFRLIGGPVGDQVRGQAS